MWLHVSHTPIDRIKAVDDQCTDMKPRGLYFGRDRQWFDWTQREGYMGQSTGDHIYEGILHKDARVLRLETIQDVVSFMKLYAAPSKEFSLFEHFDWSKVQNDYDAMIIEYHALYTVELMIDPQPHMVRLAGFVDSFDVDTLVVFRPKAMSSLNLVGCVE